MKYLVMVQGTQADYEAQAGKPPAGLSAWSDEDVQVMYQHMGAINNDLAETGELIDAQGLAEPARTRLVSAGADGKPVITDGPYGETKEVIAGFWLLECESLERVTEIAERVIQCPVPEGANTYPVVIRPVGEV
jgi:hypothetical protein